jgi:hypothetical protein
MAKMKHQKRNNKASNIPEMKSNVSKDFPDRLYIVKSDKKKPYIRLE